MLKTSLRTLSFALLFALSTNATGKGVDEIDGAIKGLGSYLNNGITTQIAATSILVVDDGFRQRAMLALPAEIRDHRILQGRLLERTRSIYARVLDLHGRNREPLRPTLILFENDVPTAQIWRGCVLLVSTRLAALLCDGELAGILAHELGHAYFDDQMAAAQRNRDEAIMRIIELQCDGVALMSLKSMGYKPEYLLSGLKQIEMATKRQGLSAGILQSHPDLTLRARFSDRIIKLMS